MKIILGSDLSFLLKYGYRLTNIPKEAMRIGYITTAAKGARDQSFFDNVKSQILNEKIYIEEYDIEGKLKEEILSFFKDKNIIHLEGGNTFYLINAIRHSGFADALAEMLREGKVFIGTSAGAYVMCPSIEVADWDKSGRDRYSVTDFTALGYVPFVLKVHYKDESKTDIEENMKSLQYPLRILRDGEGIVVDSNGSRYYGDTEETIIYESKN